MQIDIKPAAEADIAAIMDIVEPIIRAGETYPYEPTLARSELENIWFAPANKVYAARDAAGKILGTFYIRPNQPGLGDHICNAGFMVAPDQAGAGVGTEMGRSALEEAKKLGFRAMQFNLVLASNQGSLKIWDKLGFDRIGRIPAAFRLPSGQLDDAYILYRQL